MTHASHMSSYTSRAIFISFMLLLSLNIQSQGQKKFAERMDTIPLFRGIVISFDLVGAGQLMLSSYGQYEAALRLNLKDKFFPIIEAGVGKANEEEVSTRVHYQTSAPYGRIGIDFNVMKDKHDDYRVYAGGRYAFSSFKYDVFSPGLTDPIWRDHIEYNYPNNKASWHWLELAAGIDAKIWKFFRLGWSVRYKRRLFHSEADLGNPWYVPGFGKQGGTRLGVAFNVIFEL